MSNDSAKKEEKTLPYTLRDNDVNALKAFDEATYKKELREKTQAEEAAKAAEIIRDTASQLSSVEATLAKELIDWAQGKLVTLNDEKPPKYIPTELSKDRHFAVLNFIVKVNQIANRKKNFGEIFPLPEIYINALNTAIANGIAIQQLSQNVAETVVPTPNTTQEKSVAAAAIPTVAQPAAVEIQGRKPTIASPPPPTWETPVDQDNAPNLKARGDNIADKQKILKEEDKKVRHDAAMSMLNGRNKSPSGREYSDTVPIRPKTPESPKKSTNTLKIYAETLGRFLKHPLATIKGTYGPATPTPTDRRSTTR